MFDSVIAGMILVVPKVLRIVQYEHIIEVNCEGGERYGVDYVDFMVSSY